MIIADRVRSMRETKKLSQADIEKRTAQMHISGVEKGHTAPSVETWGTVLIGASRRRPRWHPLASQRVRQADELYARQIRNSAGRG